MAQTQNIRGPQVQTQDVVELDVGRRTGLSEQVWIDAERTTVIGRLPSGVPALVEEVRAGLARICFRDEAGQREGWIALERGGIPIVRRLENTGFEKISSTLFHSGDMAQIDLGDKVAATVDVVGAQGRKIGVVRNGDVVEVGAVGDTGNLVYVQIRNAAGEMAGGFIPLRVLRKIGNGAVQKQEPRRGVFRAFTLPDHELPADAKGPAVRALQGVLQFFGLLSAAETEVSVDKFPAEAGAPSSTALVSVRRVPAAEAELNEPTLVALGALQGALQVPQTRRYDQATHLELTGFLRFLTGIELMNIRLREAGDADWISPQHDLEVAAGAMGERAEGLVRYAGMLQLLSAKNLDPFERARVEKDVSELGRVYESAKEEVRIAEANRDENTKKIQTELRVLGIQVTDQDLLYHVSLLGCPITRENLLNIAWGIHREYPVTARQFLEKYVPSRTLSYTEKDRFLLLCLSCGSPTDFFIFGGAKKVGMNHVAEKLTNTNENFRKYDESIRLLCAQVCIADAVVLTLEDLDPLNPYYKNFLSHQRDPHRDLVILVAKLAHSSESAALSYFDEKELKGRETFFMVTFEQLWRKNPKDISYHYCQLYLGNEISSRDATIPREVEQRLGPKRRHESRVFSEELEKTYGIQNDKLVSDLVNLGKIPDAVKLMDMAARHGDDTALQQIVIHQLTNTYYPESTLQKLLQLEKKHLLRNILDTPEAAKIQMSVSLNDAAMFHLFFPLVLEPRYQFFCRAILNGYSPNSRHCLVHLITNAQFEHLNRFALVCYHELNQNIIYGINQLLVTGQIKGSRALYDVIKTWSDLGMLPGILKSMEHEVLKANPEVKAWSENSDLEYFGKEYDELMGERAACLQDFLTSKGLDLSPTQQQYLIEQDILINPRNRILWEEICFVACESHPEIVRSIIEKVLQRNIPEVLCPALVVYLDTPEQISRFGSDWNMGRVITGLEMNLSFFQGRAKILAATAHLKRRNTVIDESEFSDHLVPLVHKEGNRAIFRKMLENFRFPPQMLAESLETLGHKYPELAYEIYTFLKEQNYEFTSEQRAGTVIPFLRSYALQLEEALGKSFLRLTGRMTEDILLTSDHELVFLIHAELGNITDLPEYPLAVKKYRNWFQERWLIREGVPATFDALALEQKIYWIAAVTEDPESKLKRHLLALRAQTEYGKTAQNTLEEILGSVSSLRRKVQVLSAILSAPEVGDREKECVHHFFKLVAELSEREADMAFRELEQALENSGFPLAKVLFLKSRLRETGVGKTPNEYDLYALMENADEAWSVENSNPVSKGLTYLFDRYGAESLHLVQNVIRHIARGTKSYDKLQNFCYIDHRNRRIIRIDGHTLLINGEPLVGITPLTAPPPEYQEILMKILLEQQKLGAHGRVSPDLVEPGRVGSMNFETKEKEKKVRLSAQCTGSVNTTGELHGMCTLVGYAEDGSVAFTLRAPYKNGKLADGVGIYTKSGRPGVRVTIEGSKIIEPPETDPIAGGIADLRAFFANVTGLEVIISHAPLVILSGGAEVESSPPVAEGEPITLELQGGTYICRGQAGPKRLLHGPVTVAFRNATGGEGGALEVTYEHGTPQVGTIAIYTDVEGRRTPLRVLPLKESERGDADLAIGNYGVLTRDELTAWERLQAGNSAQEAQRVEVPSALIRSRASRARVTARRAPLEEVVSTKTPVRKELLSGRFFAAGSTDNAGELHGPVIATVYDDNRITDVIATLYQHGIPQAGVTAVQITSDGKISPVRVIASSSNPQVGIFEDIDQSQGSILVERDIGDGGIVAVSKSPAGGQERLQGPGIVVFFRKNQRQGGIAGVATADFDPQTGRPQIGRRNMCISFEDGTQADLKAIQWVQGEGYPQFILL